MLYNLSHNFKSRTYYMVGIIWFLWYFKNKHFGLCFAAPEVRTPKLRHLNCNVSVYITLIQEILWNLNHEDWVCFEIVEMSYAIHQFTPFFMKTGFRRPVFEVLFYIFIVINRLWTAVQILNLFPNEIPYGLDTVFNRCFSGDNSRDYFKPQGRK